MFREGLHGPKELVSFYQTECKKSYTLTFYPQLVGSGGWGQIPPLHMSLDVKEKQNQISSTYLKTVCLDSFQALQTWKVNICDQRFTIISQIQKGIFLCFLKILVHFPPCFTCLKNLEYSSELSNMNFLSQQNIWEFIKRKMPPDIVYVLLKCQRWQILA